MPPTLFQKLFNKRNALSPQPRSSKDYPAFSWPITQLEPSQIRLIVYQDCERRGRNVLFDSSTKKRGAEETPITRMCSEGQAKMFGKCCQLHPTGGSSSSLDSSSSSSCASENRDSKEQGLRFQASRCSSDVVMLGEMMFGSVAMSYKGSTLKIHQIRSPPQLMLSKVFTARTGGSVSGSLNTLQDSLEFIGGDPNTLRPDPNNSLLGNIGHSNPMDMPGRGMYDERDSGIARSASLSSLLITPFPSPGSSLSSSCASSYQRRWLRSQTTSLENGVFPRWSVDESFNMSDDSGGPGLGVARKKKIAIGVIFLLSPDPEENSRFQDFFFSHFPLFESHMNKLKSAIEQAMKMSRRSADVNQRALAYSRMVEGLNEFRTTICDLYTMPRVAEPVWLTMRSVAPERQLLCSNFMRELALLVEQASKNQFLPALLTAILTNHLAWVPTVMPNGHPPIKIFLEKHSSQSVDMLAKTHPYNPLWAQLGDLYGAIGSPVRLSRTVVVGRRQEMVQRLLYVLTYFIRCSELLESHLLDSVEDEAIVMPGSLITTSLRRGEVEESDYVLITVHKPSGDYLGQAAPGAPGPGGGGDDDAAAAGCHLSDGSQQSSTETDTGAEPCGVAKAVPAARVTVTDDEDEDSSESQGSRSSLLQAGQGGVVGGPELPMVGAEEEEQLHRESVSPQQETRLEAVVSVGSASPSRTLPVPELQSPSTPITPTTPTPVSPGEKEGPGDTASADCTHPIRIPGPLTMGVPLEKKPPDKSPSPTAPSPLLGVSLATPVSMATGPMALREEEEQPANKVTFLIGDSMSPESDTESRRRRVEEEFKKHKKHLKDKQQQPQPQQPPLQQQQSEGCDSPSSSSSSALPEDRLQPGRVRPCALPRVSSKMPQWGCGAGTEDYSHFDEYFSLDHPVETRTIDDPVSTPPGVSTTDRTHKELLDPSGAKPPAGASQGPAAAAAPEAEARSGSASERCGCDSTEGHCCCGACSAAQDQGIVVAVTAPRDAGLTKGDQKQAETVPGDWDIPRNESLDSALGDSESEDTEDWQEEVLVPFPGAKQTETYSKPSIANFGRSLFGGYCPTYVPDFVLQGIPCDEALRQGLVAELSHAVQHPVLDEPIAEAVCIIADTDRWTVQVASSQRRATDVNKLGKEVLVSSLVSSLLQSTYQLYKLNLSPNFCVMHLEDRLQEIYFKSKMLAEYLKGQTRVHVKELGMVLGIESSDLPLLAAVASTHSPYVAQILL